MSDTLQKDLPGQEPARSAPGGNGAALSSKVKSLRLTGVEMQRPQGSSKTAWLLCLCLLGTTGYLAWDRFHAPTPEESRQKLVSYLRQSSPDLTAENAEKLWKSIEDGINDTPAGTVPTAPRPAETSARSGNLSLDSKGYIVPAHQILVSPKVGGMVRYLRIHKPGQKPEEGIQLEEGLRVEKGDILAVLESTDYEADVARCRAILAAAEQKLLTERKNVPQEIERAQAELSEANSQCDYAKAVLERNKMLAKNGSVSPIELEKSQSEYDALRHRVSKLARALEIVRGPQVERIKVAEADVNSARADLGKAEWRLENCTIVAPITGTLLRKNVEEGNIVNPVAFNGSFSICDMADLSNLEVDLSIQERDISRVFKDQKCIVRAEAYPDRNYRGYVSRLMPIADRAKGAVSVRVKISVPADEEGVYLKPEMGAIVTFYAADAQVPQVELPATPQAPSVR